MMDQKGVCRNCGKEKNIRELYRIVISSLGYIYTYGEIDCKGCRERTKKGEKVST